MSNNNGMKNLGRWNYRACIMRKYLVVTWHSGLYCCLPLPAIVHKNGNSPNPLHSFIELTYRLTVTELHFYYNIYNFFILVFSSIEYYKISRLVQVMIYVYIYIKNNCDEACVFVSFQDMGQMTITPPQDFLELRRSIPVKIIKNEFFISVLNKDDAH